jgi:hypothetical protein
MEWRVRVWLMVLGVGLGFLWLLADGANSLVLWTSFFFGGLSFLLAASLPIGRERWERKGVPMLFAVALGGLWLASLAAEQPRATTWGTFAFAVAYLAAAMSTTIGAKAPPAHAA